MVNVTISGNAVNPGVPGNPEVRGASILVKQGSIALTNNIVSCIATQTNISGTLIDGGHNLCSDASANFTSATSRNNTDPFLAPLADNGGPTPTMALLPASPAIDAGDDSVAPSSDQRDVPRPMGAASDIGAFEFGPVLTLERRRTGEVNLDCLCQPLKVYRVRSSTNLIDWLLLAERQSDTNGIFSFQDKGPTDSLRQFYRVE